MSHILQVFNFAILIFFFIFVDMYVHVPGIKFHNFYLCEY